MATGRAKDFYLPGIWMYLALAVVFTGSVLVGRPVVGVVWAWITGRDDGWRRIRRVRLAFDLVTLGMAAISATRFAVQYHLYTTDQEDARRGAHRHGLAGAAGDIAGALFRHSLGDEGHAAHRRRNLGESFGDRHHSAGQVVERVQRGVLEFVAVFRSGDMADAVRVSVRELHAVGVAGRYEDAPKCISET